MKKAEKKPTVEVSLLKRGNMVVAIEQLPDAPGHLQHMFSNDAQEKMESKQRKGGKTVRGPRESIEKEVESCIHRLPNGKVGYPASAFRNGMREVAPYYEGANKKLVSGSVRVIGEQGTDNIEIEYKTQTTQKDIGRLANGTPKTIYRPRFDGWKCKLRIVFDSSQISPEQIINLLNYAGFHRGIGDWRPGSPRNPGQYGMYKVSIHAPGSKGKK